MNVIEFKMEKKEFKIYICKKYEGEGDLIDKQVDEIYSHSLNKLGTRCLPGALGRAKPLKQAQFFGCAYFDS